MDTPRSVTELLRDVTAFANASGGQLIFGVSEVRDDNNHTTGVPSSLVPFPVENVDRLRIRLLDKIRGSVDPPIVGLAMDFIECSEGEYVAILRVPPSLSAPHMITEGAGAQRGNSRFYYRHGSNKQPMDVSEIRAAFVRSQSQQALVRTRLKLAADAILAGETPLDLGVASKLCLLLLPIDAVSAEPPTVDFDHASVRSLLQPIRGFAPGARFNFDGYLTYAVGQSGENLSSYTQLYHDGSIEAVSTDVLRIARGTGAAYLEMDVIAGEIVKACQRYLKAQQLIGLSIPVYVAMAFLEFRGVQLRSRPGDIVHELDRDNMLLPPMVLDSFEPDVPAVFRPAFDRIWQAFGFESSSLYERGAVFGESL